MDEQSGTGPLPIKAFGDEGCEGSSAGPLSDMYMVQGWVWHELDHYTARICEIGVDGHALYNLEGTAASNSNALFCLRGACRFQLVSSMHVTFVCPHR